MYKKVKKNTVEAEKPYLHCDECKYKGNRCRVWDRFQRYPREEGGLGMCIKIIKHKN